MLFNEIYTSIFEKNKIVQAHERSTIQLMNVLSRNDEKDIINHFKCTAKTYSTLDDKKFIPFYAEHIHFLVKRSRWLVTATYQHFTFEQTKFKKNFVILNQKSRQKATSLVERDFYKLLKNANLGIDCSNNIDNCTLEPIYDEISEIAYIKKFDITFDNKNYRDFYNVEIMREEVNLKYDQLLLNLNKNDPTYEARKYWYQNKREKDLDAIDSLEAKKSGERKENFIILSKKLKKPQNRKKNKNDSRI